MSNLYGTSALLNPPAVPEPSVGAQRPPSLITYAEGNVPPPSQLYVGLNDQLQVLAQTSQSATSALFLDIRILLPDGTIQIQQESVPSSPAYAITNAIFRLAEGFLLSVALRSVNQQQKRGDYFAVINLIRQPSAITTLNLCLTRGYVTVNSPVCFPVIPQDFPQQKPGAIRIQAITTPAAGADFTITVPNFMRWRIIGLRASFVTSASVATRAAILQFQSAANVMYNACAAATQAASLTLSYNWGAGVTTLLAPVGATTLNVETAIPVDLWMGAGMIINSVTQNIQAADQWSLIFMLIEESIDC